MDDQPVIEPPIGVVQADVAFANSFRIELIKLTQTLATALLAFTVTFLPTVENAIWLELMWVGWLTLGLSTVGGMINMYGWERYFAAFRDFRQDIPKGRAIRKRVTRWRRVGATVQFAGFGIGVMCIAAFAALNIGRVPL